LIFEAKNDKIMVMKKIEITEKSTSDKLKFTSILSTDNSRILTRCASNSKLRSSLLLGTLS